MNKKAPAKQNLRVWVSCALLVAIHVVLGRFLSIQTPVVRIGFSFVPLAVAGMMFGPGYAFAVGGVADLLGYVMNPMGAYHPGFTLVTALMGMTYGFLLREKDGEKWTNGKFLVRSVIAVLITCFPLCLGLNTLWLTQILDKGYLVLFPARVIKEVVTAAAQLLTINLVHMVLVEPLLRRRAWA